METLGLKRITSTWIITILLLFLIAIGFGITMRLNQGGDIDIDPATFYSLMTVHGLTMIGIWACAGMVGVHYLLSRYVNVSTKLSAFAFITTVIGIIMLWTSTLVGDFHAGWTFLYPLPFRIAWEDWATPLFLWGLAVLTISWLIWTIGLMMHIFKKYSLHEAFAWQHFTFKHDVKNPTPPLILIANVSLIGILVCLLTAIVMLVLFFMEYYSDGKFVNDPLLMKNIIFFFGHTIANEALYLGLAVLYELMPEISGQTKAKTTWYVAIGWNCSLFFILTAYFHHLYMDFVQPYGLQVFGQFASYFATLPSTAVTVFSVIVIVFRNKVKWTITNLLFFIGIVGWVIGGIGALIDSTISNNVILHNTLWVPAHFHTYNAMGNVLFSIAFFYWAANEFFNGKQEAFRFTKWKIGLLLLGGFGFVLMFYFGGAYSVPRRYSTYPEELLTAKPLASLGALFASVYLLAILWMFFDIIKKCTKVFSSSVR